MNKILRSFVNEHRRLPRTDASRDLAAYRAAHPQEAEAPARTRSRSDSPWAWVTVAAVMVVALVLSLTLTLAKPATSPSGQDNPAQDPQEELHYCDSSAVQYNFLESVEAFNEKYDCHVVYNSNHYVNCSEMIDTETGECIGALIGGYGFACEEDFETWDGIYYQSQVKCFTGDARIEFVVIPFEHTDREIEVDGLHVKYIYRVRSSQWEYEYDWWQDGYEYVAWVVLFEDIGVEEAFRRYIFPQKN